MEMSVAESQLKCGGTHKGFVCCRAPGHSGPHTDGVVGWSDSANWNASTQHTAVGGLTIKDSGTRRDFGTGSVRDAAVGKGRMDLMPGYALASIMADPSVWRATGATGLDEDRDIYTARESALANAFKALQNRETLFVYLKAAAFDALHALQLREESEKTKEIRCQSRTDCFPLALIAVSKLYEAGCQKYGDRNWEKGQPIHVFMDSGIRHLAKNMAGQVDEDHLVAACWNFLSGLDTLIRVRAGMLPESLVEGIPVRKVL